MICLYTTHLIQSNIGVFKDSCIIFCTHTINARFTVIRYLIFRYCGGINKILNYYRWDSSFCVLTNSISLDNRRWTLRFNPNDIGNKDIALNQSSISNTCNNSFAIIVLNFIWFNFLDAHCTYTVNANKFIVPHGRVFHLIY